LKLRTANFLSIIVLVLLNLINRRPKVGVIDFSDDEFGEDEPKSYCKHCLEYGFQVPLQNRIYPEGEPVPADKDQWKQCLDCGSIYAAYELEKESQIKNVVETIDSPFDSGVEFLGVDSRKSSRKKRKQDDDYDYINDEDLKRELKKGSKLLSYSEQIPQ
jgi:hypothetical protein